MAGTVRALDRQSLTWEEESLWHGDFKHLVESVGVLLDLRLGADLERRKEFYHAVAEVGKGYFNKPFGGVNPTENQYGFRMLSPQDLRTTISGETPAYISWRQKVTIGQLGKVPYVFGYSNGPVFSRKAAGASAVLAFHSLVSYQPTPDISLVGFNVNDYQYPPFSVELFAKVCRGEETRLLPMPKFILLHPGGSFSLYVYFDIGVGSTVDIELAPLGLVFAEYNYLAAE